MLLGRRHSTLTAASIALIGAAAPMASAEPWFHISFGNWGSHPRVIRQPACPPPVVVARPPVVVVRQPVVVRRVEVVPCDLRFTAYQARDTVIVIANGTDTTGGFETCLSSRTGRDFSTTVVLTNTSPAQCATQCVTPFEVSGSFRVRGCVRTVEVRVADRCLQVPVTQVQSLSS